MSDAPDASSKGVRFSPPSAASAGMASPELLRHDSSGSSNDSENDEKYQFTPAIPATPHEDVPPIPDSAAFGGWSATASVRSRGSIANEQNGSLLPSIQTNGVKDSRPRAGMMRMPSNAYTPANARRPQYSMNNSSKDAARHHNPSATRKKANPNAEYRAQERAYVQRIRQDVPEYEQDINDLRTPSLDDSSNSDSDLESPSTAEYFDNDPYDQETLLYYGNDDMQPSVEELKIPENRERLEWHSMLASVLTGDVVKQEKKRLIGGGEQHSDSALKAEMWTNIRARVTGRPIQVQRKVLDEGRIKAKADIDSITAFEIKGETEVGKTAVQQ
ncbi:hypothetical protein LTS18_001197, partial [Coniosporium uncinatum]